MYMYMLFFGRNVLLYMCVCAAVYVSMCGRRCSCGNSVDVCRFRSWETKIVSIVYNQRKDLLGAKECIYCVTLTVSRK